MTRQRVNAPVVSVAGALVFGALLSGCGWMGGSGGCDKNRDYVESRDESPIEVPPDLTEPDYGSGVDIPETGEPKDSLAEEGGCLEEPPNFDTGKQENEQQGVKSNE